MRPTLLLFLSLACAALAPLGAAADAPSVEAARLDFAPVVKRVAPSVVTVFSSRTAHVDQAAPPWMDDDPILRHFFGGDPRGGEREQKQRGLGSGVVVRADGYILTNNHVVEEADEVKVGFADGSDEY